LCDDFLPFVALSAANQGGAEVVKRGCVVRFGGDCEPQGRDCLRILPLLRVELAQVYVCSDVIRIDPQNFLKERDCFIGTVLCFGDEAENVNRLRRCRRRGTRGLQFALRARKIGHVEERDAEIELLWRATGDLYPAGSLVRFLLLTAVRRSEAAGMTWAELNLDAALWVVPAHCTKSGIAHEVPLSGQAVDLLRSLPRFSGGDFVFSTTGGRRSARRFSHYKDVISARAPGLVDWRFHDLRRTARSLMSRAKVSREHAERVLGHAIPGVEGVYNRYQFADEKADALQRLAGLVEDILKSPVDLSQEAHELRDANQAKERNTLLMAKKVKAKPRKRAKAKPASKERRADGLVVGSDGAKLVDAICAKSGATHAELKALIKWKSCLPFAMKSAKQAGIRLRKEREGKEVRYYGTARA